MPSRVTLATGASEINAALRSQAPDMVIAITQILTPPIEDWIREVRNLPNSPDVVLVHDREDVKFRASAIRAGCLAVLGTSLTLDELAATIQALIRRRVNGLRVVHATSPMSESRLQDFASLSPRMTEFLTVARKVVESDSSLLMQGETGTGKERLARAFHQDGPRSAGPFVAVNCGALPESLFESELFGHAKGAFTGATRTHKGLFEQADGGTLFLDEVGEIPLHLQVKLLRVLEDRRVNKVGAEGSVPVDIRLIAATNRDLERAVEVGRFRKDLFYRLAVVTLTLPPLRERSEDVPDLLAGYLDVFRASLNRPIFGFERAALEALLRYGWPGNVRELINVVERAVLLSPGPEIGLADLPAAISSQVAGVAAVEPLDSGGQGESSPVWLDQPLQGAREQVVADFENQYLSHLLRETGGRVGEAAKRAGINERSLFELMRRHRLRKEDFRASD